MTGADTADSNPDPTTRKRHAGNQATPTANAEATIEPHEPENWLGYEAQLFVVVMGGFIICASLLAIVLYGADAARSALRPPVVMSTAFRTVTETRRGPTGTLYGCYVSCTGSRWGGAGL